MDPTVLKGSDMPTTLVWFRDDLGLTDNPALTWAAERGDVVGVVVDETTSRPLGRAATWWRDRSIAELSGRLSRRWPARLR